MIYVLSETPPIEQYEVPKEWEEGSCKDVYDPWKEKKFVALIPNSNQQILKQ